MSTGANMTLLEEMPPELAQAREILKEEHNQKEDPMKEGRQAQNDSPIKPFEEEKPVQKEETMQEEQVKLEPAINEEGSKKTEKPIKEEETDRFMNEEMPDQKEVSMKEGLQAQNDSPIKPFEEEKPVQEEEPIQEEQVKLEPTMNEEGSKKTEDPIKEEETDMPMSEEMPTPKEDLIKEGLQAQNNSPIEPFEEEKTIQEEQAKLEPAMDEEGSKKTEETMKEEDPDISNQAIEELKQGNLDSAFCLFSSKDENMSEEIAPWDLLTHSIALIPVKPLQAHCYLRFLDELFLASYEESDLNTIRTHLYFHLARTWLSDEAQKILADTKESFENASNCLQKSVELDSHFIEAMYIQFKILEHSVEYSSDPNIHQKKVDFLKRTMLTLSGTPGLDSNCVNLLLKRGHDYINQSKFPIFARRTISMLFFEYGKVMCQYEMKDYYDEVKLGVSLYACAMGLDQNIYALLALGVQTLYRGVPHIDENPHFEAHSVSSMVDLIKRDQEDFQQKMYMEVLSKYKKLLRSGQIFNTVIVWAFALPNYEYLDPNTTLIQLKALMYLGIVKGKLGKMEMDLGNRLRIYKEAKSNLGAAIRGISDENTLKNVPFWEKSIIESIEFREAYYELGKLYEKNKLHMIDGHVTDTVNCWRCLKDAQVNYKKCEEFMKPTGLAIQYARKFSSLYEYKKDPNEPKVHQIKLRSPINPCLIKCDVYEKRKQRELIHNHFTYDAFTKEVLLTYFAASSYDDLVKRFSELKEGVNNEQVKKVIDLFGQILDSEKTLRLIQGAECNLPLALYDISLKLPSDKQAILLKGNCYPIARLKYIEIGAEAMEDAPPEIVKECTRMARKALKELKNEVALLECDMKRVDKGVQDVLDEMKHIAEQMITEARAELNELLKKEGVAVELENILVKCNEAKLYISNTLSNTVNTSNP